MGLNLKCRFWEDRFDDGDGSRVRDEEELSNNKI
jgi:hypothetical protein